MESFLSVRINTPGRINPALAPTDELAGCFFWRYSQREKCETNGLWCCSENSTKAKYINKLKTGKLALKGEFGLKWRYKLSAT